MILLSKDPREPALRQKLIDLLGGEDAETLVQWVYENEGRNNVRYCQALYVIVMGIETQGMGFAHNLLEAAKKPKHIWEAERQILGWLIPRLKEAGVVIQGHRDDPVAVDAEREKLIEGLLEMLWKMYPDKHRATMKGAVVGSFQRKGSEIGFNVAMLVKALNLEDPLWATAGQSRG